MEKKVSLVKLTWDDVDRYTKLKVNKYQKGFVASNKDSLIDGKMHVNFY